MPIRSQPTVRRRRTCATRRATTTTAPPTSTTTSTPTTAAKARRVRPQPLVLTQAPPSPPLPVCVRRLTRVRGVVQTPTCASRWRRAEHRCSSSETGSTTRIDSTGTRVCARRCARAVLRGWLAMAQGRALLPPLLGSTGTPGNVTSAYVDFFIDDMCTCASRAQRGCARVNCRRPAGLPPSPRDPPPTHTPLPCRSQTWVPTTRSCLQGRRGLACRCGERGEWRAAALRARVRSSPAT